MRYEFVVEGRISETVQAALPEVESTSCRLGATALYGSLKDQSDVMTVIARISDLGLSLVEMRRLPE